MIHSIKEDKISLLNQLKTLDIDDIYNDIEYINLRENKRLGCKVVSLEEIYKFSNDNGLLVGETIENLLEHVKNEQITFAYEPFSFLFDENIRNLKEELENNNISTYVLKDSLSEEAILFDKIINYCIINEDISILENDIQDYLINIGKAGANYTQNLIPGSFEKGLHKTLKDSISKKIGSVSDKKNEYGKVEKGKKIEEWVYNKTGNQMLADLGKNIANEGRDTISDDAATKIIETGKELLNKARHGGPEEARRIMNAMNSKVDTLETQMYQAPPQKKGFFARIIDAIKRIIRKIKEFIFGQSGE